MYTCVLQIVKVLEMENKYAAMVALCLFQKGLPLASNRKLWVEWWWSSLSTNLTLDYHMCQDKSLTMVLVSILVLCLVHVRPEHY